MSIRETFKLSFKFGVFWFLCNYTFNASLTMTSVSSNTILNTLSGLFTLVVGAAAGVDSFTVVKLLAVMCALGGVALVSLEDTEQDGSDSLKGDLLCVLSSMMYACYIVFLKLRIPHEDQVNMTMFFAFLGLINFVVLMPFFYVLSATGVETWEWPSSETLSFLSLNAFVGSVLSDYLWLFSVVLTSPVVSTVGLSLTIPFAMLSDVVLGKAKSFSAAYLLGCFLVLVGFFLVNVPAGWCPVFKRVGGPRPSLPVPETYRVLV